MNTSKPFMTITDHSLGLADGPSSLTTTERHAARAIIFNEEGRIALLYTEKHGHHKLPGGGIDPGEDWTQALMREAVEEAGCHVRIRDLFIGQILEIRGKDRLTQRSFCGVADVTEYRDAPSLTDDEINDGYTPPKWVTLDQAVQLFQQDQPKTYLGQFMHKRDFAFLTKSIEQLSPEFTADKFPASPCPF